MKKNKLYRLSLIEDRTHKQIHAFRFTPFSAGLALVSALLIIFGIVWCTIAFTPIRQSIPGYPDEYSKNLAVDNAMKIDSLENIITRWEFYAANLSAALGGDTEVNLEEVIGENRTKYLKNISEEQMRQADSLLRLKVKEEGQ